MHLTLYPAKLTKAQFEAGAAALCALPYAIQPRVSQSINGDWSLSFQYPLSGSTGADLLALDMLVLADGQLYRIEDRERGSGRDSERCTVRAVHLMYDLRNRAIENIETAELTPGGVNQEIALEQVLNGSAFSAGTVDTDIVLDYLDILQKDVMWAIKEQILPQWGGELLPDNWTLNIRKQMGADRGVHLRHGKNIKGVRYSESLDGVVTRLHILGYQNANIESINAGKDYIDSANIGLWSTPREDYVTFPDDDLPEDLLSKGTAYLATVDTPRITLSVDLAQVRTSDQYKYYKDLERVELGDTVTVYHSRLGINITARVQSREFDPVTGENYRVELGNDNRNLYSSIASLQQAADITRMIADRNGHVRGERLRGVIDLLTSRLFASGSYVNAVVNDETGILFENTNIESVDYGAMFIGPGIFAIANEKDITGQWTWRTFGTAGGFYGSELVAESVTANKLASDVGQALDISSNEAITQIVQDTTDLDSRVHTAEQKITPDAITSTVRNHANYQADLAGKNRTYVLSTPPSGAITGDLWIDTANGNLLKRWNGSSWVNVQDGAISIAQQTANKFSWLISSGTSASDMVLTDEAYALTTAKAMIAAEQEITLQVGGIKVGGTNLLLDSGNPRSTNRFININTYDIFADIPIGTPVTISFDIIAQYARPILVYPYQNNGLSIAGSTEVTPATDKYTRFSFVTAVHWWGDYDPGYTDGSIALYDYAGDNNYTIKRIKIEKGNKATDWSPAPADPAGGVKTSHITLTPTLLELLSGADMVLGGVNFGLSTKHPSGVLLWAGGSDPLTAPLALYRDGTMRNGANIYMQNWATEAEAGQRVKFPVFFSSDLFTIDKVLLWVRFKPFRATSKGAAAGGGTSVTSESGGGATVTSAVNGSDNTGPATGDTGGPSEEYTGYGGTGNTGSGSGHTHTITNHRHSYTMGASDTGYTQPGATTEASHTHSGPNHRHSLSGHVHNLGAHTHTLNQHTHSVSISAHSHTVTLADHTHELVYGIYEGTTATGAYVGIDGTDYWNIGANDAAFDIAPQFGKTSGKISRGSEHTIEIVPNAMTRIEVQIMVKGCIVTNTLGSL